MDWEYGPVTVSRVHRKGLPWVVDFTFAGPIGTDGLIECVAVTVRSVPREELGGADPLLNSAAPPEAVTASALLRDESFATLISAARRQLATISQTVAEADIPWEHEDSREGAMAREARRVNADVARVLKEGRPKRAVQPPGRPALPEDHLKRVAEVYSAAVRNHEFPTKAVSEILDAPLSSAKQWVMKARRRGYLGPTTPGKAGGLSKRSRS